MSELLQGSVPQHDAQQGTMDLKVTVVGNEAQLPEFVHEVTDARTRRADDIGQRLLADARRDRLRTAFLAEIRQQEKSPREPLFARVEELVDQVLLYPAVAR